MTAQSPLVREKNEPMITSSHLTCSYSTRAHPLILLSIKTTLLSMWITHNRATHKLRMEKHLFWVKALLLLTSKAHQCIYCQWSMYMSTCNLKLISMGTLLKDTVTTSLSMLVLATLIFMISVLRKLYYLSTCMVQQTMLPQATHSLASVDYD